MPESSEQMHARVTAATEEAGGRLPPPSIAEWDVFPWEVVDGVIMAKRLGAPADEPPRQGEGGKACPACADVSDRLVWTDDVWRVVHLGPTGLPVAAILETVEHVDFPDLDEEQAAEFGRLTIRLTRIIESMPGIGRCHVDRWGDGGSHLHVWFWGRPERQGQILGSYAVEWADILPAVPEETWRADLAAVAEEMASHSGRSILA